MIRNAIIAGLNRYLKCDRERAQDLQAIDQKVITIKLKQPETTTTFRINDCLLEEVSDEEVSTDVKIIASLKVLPDYFLGVDQNQFIKNGDLEILGDSHVASTFHNVLKGIEIDWEDILSNVIGDVAANQVGTAVDKAQGFIKNLGDNFRMDVRDYLQDDLQVVVTQTEVDDFIKQVNETEVKLDQLEMRVNQLSANK